MESQEQRIRLNGRPLGSPPFAIRSRDYPFADAERRHSLTGDGIAFQRHAKISNQPLSEGIIPDKGIDVDPYD